MTTDDQDPIDRLFDQAVKDGRREAVCEHWPDVLRVEIATCLVGGEGATLRDAIDAALIDVTMYPNVADLKPREYERLYNALAGIKAAITEFEEAWEVVETNMERWHEESDT